MISKSKYAIENKKLRGYKEVKMEKEAYYIFLVLIMVAALILSGVTAANTADIDKEMSNMNIKTATFAMG